MVGTGYMARKHSQVLAAHPQASLAVVCSSPRSLRIGEEFVREYGYRRATSDYESVLADDQVDAIYLANPDAFHPDYTVQALEAGKHVLCEKPLGRVAADFERIKQARKDSQAILQVGMNCRYREQYSIAQRLVASGELGELRFLRGSYLHNTVKLARDRDKPWWLDHPRESYFFLHGGGIHFVDLLQWIAGPVRSVWARASGFELGDLGYKADTFSVSMQFASGVLGELLISAAAFRARDLSLEAWLSKGAIVDTNYYRRTDDGVGNPAQRIHVEQRVIDLGLQYQDLVQAVTTGQEPMNNFDEAYENYRIMAAIERSLRESSPVSLEAS